MLNELLNYFVMVQICTLLTGLFIGWYFTIWKMNSKRYTKWRLIDNFLYVNGSLQITHFMYRRTDKKTGLHQYKIIEIEGMWCSHEPDPAYVNGLEKKLLENEARIKELEEKDSRSITWSVEDFTEQAPQIGYRISYLQAEEALFQMIKKHDANIGISWNVVNEYIHIYGTKVTNEQK